MGSSHVQRHQIIWKCLLGLRVTISYLEIFKFKGGTKDFFEAASTTDEDVLTVRLVIV